MAQAKKNSRADKAVSDAKKKDTAKSTGKINTKKTAKKTPVVKTEYEQKLPASTIFSVICLCLGTFFLVSVIWPEGKIPEAAKYITMGLLGRVGFYFFIPVLFFLFVIHGFQTKQPVKMRTFSLVSLVLLCGCAAHLFMPETT